MIFDPFIDEEDALVEEQVAKSKSIVVYNDDHNTFEHVIYCFTKYCSHQPSQAEQCALIIHNNGKCSVKEGDMKSLKQIKEALCENNLTAKIE